MTRLSKIADSIRSGLERAFTETACPLVFVTSASIEEAHQVLLDGQIEVVLTVFDDDYWSPITDALRQASRLLTLILLLSAPPRPSEIANFGITLVADSRGTVEVQKIAIAILEGLRRVRARLAGSRGLAALQHEVLNELSMGDQHAFARALRMLTANHRSVFSSLRAEDPFVIGLQI